MSEAQTIQWFPGHMTRTKRQIEKSLKMVDIVAEILDARVPVSSRNPILGKLIGNKPRLILMNKSDMADAAATARWIAYYKEKGIKAIALDCRTGKGVNGFMPAIRESSNNAATASSLRVSTIPCCMYISRNRTIVCRV